MTQKLFSASFPQSIGALLLGAVAVTGCKASNPSLPSMESGSMGTEFSKDTEELQTELDKPQPKFATVTAQVADADPVVATVGDDVIRVSELLSTWMLLDSQGLRDMLGKLVTTKMVEGESARYKVTVGAERLALEYTKALDALRTQVQADQPDKSLDEWISGGLGLDPTRFRQGLRADVESRLLSELVVRRFVLTQDNVDIAVIVVATQEDALAAKAKIEGGEPFGRVATEMSIDFTGKFGGRIPPVVRNDSAISRLAFSTPVGKLGGPIEEAGRWILTETLAVNERLVGDWSQIHGQVEESLTKRPMAEPEYWLWKSAANELSMPDFAPFFELIGEPDGPQSL